MYFLVLYTSLLASILKYRTCFVLFSKENFYFLRRLLYIFLCFIKWSSQFLNKLIMQKSWGQLLGVLSRKGKRDGIQSIECNFGLKRHVIPEPIWWYSMPSGPLPVFIKYLVSNFLLTPQKIVSFITKTNSEFFW